MTKKRFTFVDLGETWAISVDNECKYYMHLVDNCTTVVDLLNELNDENEQLKKENRSLIIELDAHKHIQHTKYEQIKKENEQLESDLQMSREKALYWRNKAENLFGDMRTNVELMRENRQLKNELKELYGDVEWLKNDLK